MNNSNPPQSGNLWTLASWPDHVLLEELIQSFAGAQLAIAAKVLTVPLKMTGSIQVTNRTGVKPLHPVIVCPTRTAAFGNVKSNSVDARELWNVKLRGGVVHTPISFDAG